MSKSGSNSSVPTLQYDDAEMPRYAHTVLCMTALWNMETGTSLVILMTLGSALDRVITVTDLFVDVRQLTELGFDAAFHNQWTN